MAQARQRATWSRRAALSPHSGKAMNGSGDIAPRPGVYVTSAILAGVSTGSAMKPHPELEAVQPQDGEGEGGHGVTVSTTAPGGGVLPIGAMNRLPCQSTARYETPSACIRASKSAFAGIQLSGLNPLASDTSTTPQ